MANIQLVTFTKVVRFLPPLSSPIFLQFCVRSMSKVDAILPLMAAMRRREDSVHLAAETIKKMFDMNIPELVAQV